MWPQLFARWWLQGLFSSFFLIDFLIIILWFMHIYIFIVIFITHRIIFLGLSLDKTDHVIQNGPMVVKRYPPSDLISVVWFCFDGIKAKKRVSVQFELNFSSVMENKRRLFAEASDGEIKKLVDNSVQRNTKKSTKYAGTIYVRSPWEIIRRVIK
mgnify:CR=1 FL=1